MKLNWVLKEGLLFAKREEWGEEEEREGGVYVRNGYEFYVVKYACL